MATRNIASKEETPITTVLSNIKITWWFVTYWFARVIRPFFTWEKPMTFSEFISDPRRSLIEVILV